MVKHVKSRKNVLHATQRNLFPEMEMILASWIIDQRQLGLAVTPMLTKDKAKSILEELDPEAKFTASTGWFQKFCKRHYFSLRRSSTLNQTDPEDLDEKVVRFLLHFRKMKDRFPGAPVWGCDETPVFFDTPHNQTMEKVGAKEVRIRSTGGDKKMVTVMLLGCSDGSKARPTIVFKGKGCTKEDKTLKEREDVLVLYSSNGWMQTETIAQFLRKQFTADSTSLLCWDSYKCHTCPQTKEVMSEKNLINVILPGGTTRVIQTADVCWNAPFKSKIKDFWTTWMRDGEKTFTRGGRVRSPSKTQLVDFILTAWNEITEDQIKTSFNVCGQGELLDPDSLLCMREGRSCHNSLQKLKDLLLLPPNERDVSLLDECDNFVDVDEDQNHDPLEME